MFRKNIGIDIGSTQISICTAEDGLLLKEPSCAAVDIDTDEVVEAGKVAARMVEESPNKYRLCWPVWEPVVKCADILSSMLRILLRRAVGRTVLRPQMMISIPCNLTEAQANAVEDAALAAGASKAHLLEAPICAALGAGVDFSEEIAKEILLENEIEIIIKAGNGIGSAVAWGCDLTYDYVKINGDYRT